MMIMNDEAKKRKKNKKSKMKRGTRQKKKKKKSLNKYLVHAVSLPTEPTECGSTPAAAAATTTTSAAHVFSFVPLPTPLFFSIVCPFFYSWFNTCFFVFLYFVLVVS
jgi:hypothetical protein